MAQAHRRSRGFGAIRAASRRWRAEGRRAHTCPGEPVRGRQLSCTASAPANLKGGAPGRGCAAAPVARAVGRPAPDPGAGSTGVDAPPDRPPASLGEQGGGLGSGVGDCV